MHEEIDGRLWAQHGAAVAASLADMAKAVDAAFRRLVAIQFAAPRRQSAQDGC